MKAVLCVLPNALLVTLQKTPKIRGFYYFDKVNLPIVCQSKRNQAFYGLQIKVYLVHSLEKKSEGDLSVFCKVEPIKQVQAVLCVLPNALLVTL